MVYRTGEEKDSMTAKTVFTAACWGWPQGMRGHHSGVPAPGEL